MRDNREPAALPNSCGQSPRRWSTASKLAVAGVGIAVLLGLAILLWRAVYLAREAALEAQSKCPLNQLQLALHNYHYQYGCFPPAYLTDGEGTPMHSWRVLILPYIEAEELYRAYDFDEPWNGPNNILLADRMPQIYHCPTELESNSMTNYVVLVGKDTAFPFDKPTSYRDFRDGLGNTILLAEIAHSDIMWLEPRDLVVDEMSFSINHESLPSISTSRRRGPYVVTAGGVTAYCLGRQLRPETLRAFSTVAGGEEMAMAECWDTGLESLSDGPCNDDVLKRFDRRDRLRYLWLTRSQITDAGLASLKGARRLVRLYLDSTAITDEGLQHLKRLPLIDYIDLWNTRVTIPGVLDLAASLELTSIAFPQGQMRVSDRKVVDLDLSNSALTDEDMKILATVQAPVFVDLSGTAITDQSLEHVRAFIEMRTLNLADTHVTDAGLEHLSGLARLEDLELSGTRVTQEGVQRLQRALPACEIKWGRQQQ
jgi:hypothetical protein